MQQRNPTKINECIINAIVCASWRRWRQMQQTHAVPCLFELDQSGAAAGVDDGDLA